MESNTNEHIIMEFPVQKIISNTDVISNFIGNLITPAGGDIASTVLLTLKEKELLLQYKGHVSLGYGEETRSIEIIPLNELESFLVTLEKMEEKIKIKTIKKEFLFTRENSKEDNLASIMAKLIKEM